MYPAEGSSRFTGIFTNRSRADCSAAVTSTVEVAVGVGVGAVTTAVEPDAAAGAVPGEVVLAVAAPHPTRATAATINNRAGRAPTRHRPISTANARRVRISSPRGSF